MLSIFLIGISLSMDSFSVFLSLSLNKISKTKMFIIPIIVGLFHLFMPLLGAYLTNKLLLIFNINPQIISTLILFYLTYIMYKERNNVCNKSISNIFNIILVSFSVSIDSFNVGLALNGLTENILLSSIIFSLCASIITYIALVLGKYSIKYLKEKSIYLGIYIMLGISIVNLCQIFL